MILLMVCKWSGHGDMTSQFFLRYAKPLDDLLAAVKEGSVVVDLVLYIDVGIVGVVGFLFVIDKPAQAVSHDVTHRYCR